MDSGNKIAWVVCVAEMKRTRKLRHIKGKDKSAEGRAVPSSNDIKHGSPTANSTRARDSV